MSRVSFVILYSHKSDNYLYYTRLHRLKSFDTEREIEKSGLRWP